MKILLFIDSLGSGGAQRQIVELSKGFKNKGHQVEILIYHDINFFNHELDAYNIKIHLINETNYLLRILKIRTFIRSNMFELVISFLSGPSFISEISGLPSRNWKLIVGERSANPIMMNKIRWKVQRFFHVFSDFIVCNSFSNQEMIIKTYPFLKKKCITIYNIVNFDKRENYQYYVKKEVFNLLIASSHQYLKNLNGLIEAVNLLSDKHKSKLIINWYGEILDDSYYEGIKKISDYNLEQIFNFHKPVKKIDEKMMDADAIGLFSYYEGLPNSICEAMAYGKPVIATNVSDNSKLIANSKLLCIPEDYISIKSAIEELLNMQQFELEQIGLRNRMFAELNFNSDIILSSYLNLI